MDAISSTQGGAPDPTSSSAAAAAITRVGPNPSATEAQAQAASAGLTPTDKVQISLEGTQAAKYIAQARAVTPLDEKTVKALKAAIAKGNYPPPALIEGLVNLVGIGVSSASS